MDRWTKLTRASQFRIAHYVARRQGLRLQKAFPNVVSVGVGLRSRGDAKTIVDEICLRFLVSRKWKARRKQSTSIPQHVHTYARVGHKTVRISIPTDVSEFRGGAPHANLDLTEGIESRQSGNPVENGSCCCLVRNASSSGERYLLSCYHVFSPSLNGTPGDIDCVASANQNTIGPLLEIADPEATDTALDAALALVEDTLVDGVSTWGRAPASRATDYDLLSLHGQDQLFVYCRRVAPPVGGLPEVTRPSPLSASFQSLFPNPIPFDYQSTAGKILYFADTLQYIANVRPGDSGAAVMNAQGKLFGMHFYGQGNIGFALAAPRLFDPGVFPFDIVLA